MRIRCTDDGDDDIMDSVDELILSTDYLINQPEGTDMSAKKKEAKPAADEGKPAKKTAAKSNAKAEKPAKTEKAKKELPEGFGPREIPEGHTGLAALAEAAGRTPAAARRILRGAEVQKPEGQHGWYWKDGSKALKEVEKLLAKEAEA